MTDAHEIVEIEEVITRFEHRVHARMGKWAVAILGTAVALAAAGAMAWSSLTNRVTNIEEWRLSEQTEGSGYQSFRDEVRDRLARLEEQQKGNSARLEQIQSTLTRLAERL